jgi:hypothetical protein
MRGMAAAFSYFKYQKQGAQNTGSHLRQFIRPIFEQLIGAPPTQLTVGI